MAACTIKGEYPVKAEAPALCGTLRVPEDRSNPDGRQIGLRVAVVPAVATDPEPDPLFVAAGGPGDAGTQFFAWLPPVFEDVHATRDIILIDQRGTGDSNALKLPEMPDTSGLSQTDADAFLSAWADDSLASIDADPRFYTTTVAADDVDDVRAALGYETIDLYGTSYGGTLAQYYCASTVSTCGWRSSTARPRSTSRCSNGWRRAARRRSNSCSSAAPRTRRATRRSRS